MTRSTRVLLVGHTAELGGAELATLRLLDALPEHVRPTVLVLSDGPLAECLRARGHTTMVLPLDPRVASARRDALGRVEGVAAALRTLPRLALRLRSVIATERPDVVVTWTLKTHLLVTPVARALGIPVVWHVHDRIAPDYLPPRVVSLLRAAALVGPAAVVANSAVTAATLPGVRRIAVARPGLPPEAFGGTSDAPPLARRGSAECRIVMVGRLSPTKGQLEAVRALAEVLPHHPKARLRLVGAPAFGHESYQHEVRREAARLGVAEHLDLVGQVDDVAAELDAADVALHASPVAEPFGQVVAEALARGVPVVATDAGGVPEIMTEPGEAPYGKLVPPGDVGALVEALLDVLDRPAAAREAALRGRESVARRLRVQQSAGISTRVWCEVAGTAPTPPVAIAHDYLTQRGGAERVVLAMAEAWPDATVHTTMLDPGGTFPEVAGLDVVTGPLNRFGLLRRHHRLALPLLPWAAGRQVVPGERVIASSSGWAHGFPTGGRRLVYCHAPARWIYQTREYLGRPLWSSPLGWALALARPALRAWDQRAAARAGDYVVNSAHVQQQVRDAYGWVAPVVHPPFAVRAGGEEQAVPAMPEPGFYLVVSRLLPYKHVEVVIEAFRAMPERKLLIIGHGPLEERLRAVAPPNVRVVSHAPDAQLRWAYAHARALVAASTEDFGLTPLEAAAFGTPTLARRAGGYLDTVAEGLSGLFFERPTVQDITAVVLADEGRAWDADAIRRHAEAFAPEGFRAVLRDRLRML